MRTRDLEVAGDERENARFAELMALAARPVEAEPPFGLEAKLTAFIDGAAEARVRRASTWRWLFAVVASAAAAASLTAFWMWPARAPEAATPIREATRLAPEPATSPRTLAEAPTPASPLATALRGAQDWRSRKAAADTLALAPSIDAHDEGALGAALRDDPDWRVREAALAGLAARGSDTALRAMALATEDPHLPLRLTATRGLATAATRGSLAARDARDALLRRVERDPDWRVREAALAVLVRSPEARRAAALALTDGHARLRKEARAALALGTTTLGP